MADKYSLETPNVWGLSTGGSFTGNGASAPTTTAGDGFSVARTGTGTFEVTVQDVKQLLAVTAGIQYDAVDVVGVQVTAIDHAARTFEVTTISGASGAAKSAVDPGTDVVVHFHAQGKRTAI